MTHGILRGESCCNKWREEGGGGEGDGEGEGEGDGEGEGGGAALVEKGWVE
jgi:hypothetical protein